MGGSDNECGSELLGVTSNKQELPSIWPQADTVPSGNGTLEPGNGTIEPGNGTIEPGNGTLEPGNGTLEPGNEPDNLIHFCFQSTRKPGYMYEANCFNLMMCATLLSAQMLLCTCTCVHVL